MEDFEGFHASVEETFEAAKTSSWGGLRDRVQVYDLVEGTIVTFRKDDATDTYSRDDEEAVDEDDV